MRLPNPVAAAAFALLVAPACAPVHAEAPWGAPDEGYAVEEPSEPEDAPDPDEYRDDLSSYGDWYDVPDYGVVWRPTYVAGWQPYVDGYWAWTSYGWTWVSYEPWAWTLHYGRWVVLPARGWVWIPGTIWGPAWVDWYWGDGYVGWAPLSPFGHVTVINQFVFVHERDFCSHDVHRHFVHHDRLSDHVRRDWGERDHRHAPRHDRIERVSRDTVTRFDGRPRQTLAPHRERDRRPARPDTRPDLTGARRGQEGRDDAQRRHPEHERRAGSRPALGSDDDARRDPGAHVHERASRSGDDDDAAPTRRQPAAGSTGRSRVETHPDHGEPRLRGPRFDRDDSQLRPHAWGGRGDGYEAHRAPEGHSTRMDAAEPRPSGGGDHGDDGGGGGGGGGGGFHGSGTHMGLAPGARRRD